MSQLQPQMKYNVSVYLMDLLNNTVCSSDEIQLGELVSLPVLHITWTF